MPNHKCLYASNNTNNTIKEKKEEEDNVSKIRENNNTEYKQYRDKGEKKKPRI